VCVCVGLGGFGFHLENLSKTEPLICALPFVKMAHVSVYFLYPLPPFFLHLGTDFFFSPWLYFKLSALKLKLTRRKFVGI